MEKHYIPRIYQKYDLSRFIDQETLDKALFRRILSYPLEWKNFGFFIIVKIDETRG